MKLTKIYTKTGDGGQTSLVGGIKVAKNSARLEAYGTIDELSSHLGLLASMLHQDTEHVQQCQPLAEMLQRAQTNLFRLSTILATDAEALKAHDAPWVKPHLDNMDTTLRQLNGEETQLLEQEIDAINHTLPPLSSFILPGGSIPGAQCHVCRTVCRRAERRVVNVNSPITPLKYLNRLSDYLFVLARKINIIYGTEEKTWQNTCK